MEIYKYTEGNVPKEAVRITGGETNCKKAVEMIQQIIKDQKAKLSGNEGHGVGKPDYSRECTFYADGKCFRGSKCPYVHPDGQPKPKMIKFE